MFTPSIILGPVSGLKCFHLDLLPVVPSSSLLTEKFLQIYHVA